MLIKKDKDKGKDFLNFDSYDEYLETLAPVMVRTNIEIPKQLLHEFKNLKVKGKKNKFSGLIGEFMFNETKKIKGCSYNGKL